MLAALPGLHVGCHISHLYPTGASLYFTVLGRQSDDPVAQWLGFKDAASRAILAAGGTITHHHAIGRDHLPYMEAEVGETLQSILDVMDTAEDWVTANVVAEQVGISVSTARRYLGRLVATEKVELALQYGDSGRPTNLYRRTRAMDQAA